MSEFNLSDKIFDNETVCQGKWLNPNDVKKFIKLFKEGINMNYSWDRIMRDIDILAGDKLNG